MSRLLNALAVAGSLRDRRRSRQGDWHARAARYHPRTAKDYALQGLTVAPAYPRPGSPTPRSMEPSISCWRRSH